MGLLICNKPNSCFYLKLMLNEGVYCKLPLRFLKDEDNFDFSNYVTFWEYWL